MTAPGPDTTVDAERTITLGGRQYPLLLPKLTDPRLQLASIIVTLQVLGQTVLDFELSIAQILIAVGTCGVIEVAYTFWTQQVVAWPASALLTGNGVAFILRVEGTQHGDWWSTNGWWLFVATAALSIVSKYVIRFEGRPLFNPSNLGLVICFLVVGTQTVNPLDLWWGPMSPGLAAALVVILVGGLLLCRRLDLLGLSIAFWLSFAGSLGVLSASGHCMTARWHVGPVCDTDFWRIVVTSPEVLLFLFFMITDPKTAPEGRAARRAFGVAVGVGATLLIAPQTTEFATKVALLGSLVLMCGLRPAFERWLPADASAASNTGGLRSPRSPRLAALSGLGAILLVPIVIAAGVPSRNPVGAAPTSDYAPLQFRPDVSRDLPDLPSIEVDDAVGHIAGLLDSTPAEEVALDAVENLIIEARAISEGSTQLAESALFGPRLEAATELAAAGPAPDQAADYTLDELTLTLVRDPTNPQASPQLGARMSGTRRVGGEAERLDAVFLLVDVGGVFLTVDEVTPEV